MKPIMQFGGKMMSEIIFNYEFVVVVDYITESIIMTIPFN